MACRLEGRFVSPPVCVCLETCVPTSMWVTRQFKCVLLSVCVFMPAGLVAHVLVDKAHELGSLITFGLLFSLPTCCDPSLFLVSEPGLQCMGVYVCHTHVPEDNFVGSCLSFHRNQGLNLGHQICMANLELWLTPSTLSSQG